MANRQFQINSHQAFLKKVVCLYPIVSVGGSGAVTLQKRSYTAMGSTSVAPGTSLIAAPTSGVGYAVGDGAGTRTVSLGTAGLWTLTLSDSYQYLLGVRIAKTKNANGICLAAAVGVKTDGVTTNTALGSGGTMVVQLVDFAGNAVDPASGDVLTLEIMLGDHSEP